MSWSALEADATSSLTTWDAPDDQQGALRSRYLRVLAEHGPAALARGGATHLTASCVVVDAAWSQTLLVLHAKAGVWVQPGGHLEAADTSLAAAAAREVAEETGLRLGPPASAPPRLVELHHHGLGRAFGACAEHLDVAFLAVAPRALAPVVSAESRAVAWWPLDALPDGVVADLPGRLAALRERCGPGVSAPASPAGRPSPATASS